MTITRGVKSALESMMFIWGDLLSVNDAAQILNITKAETVSAFEELKEEYEKEKRGLRLRRVEDSYQFVTPIENADYIERLCRPVKKRRLSQSALEVLAIIAYRQPVTRGEIDQVRGIRSDRVVDGLIKKKLIEEKGRSEGVGRPILYGTTANFLKTFGYASLAELPAISDFAEDPDTEVEAAAALYEDGVMTNQISFAEVAEGNTSGKEKA